VGGADVVKTHRLHVSGQVDRTAVAPHPTNNLAAAQLDGSGALQTGTGVGADVGAATTEVGADVGASVQALQSPGQTMLVTRSAHVLLLINPLQPAGSAPHTHVGAEVGAHDAAHGHVASVSPLVLVNPSTTKWPKASPSSRGAEHDV
jgi:hypothetical protein